VSRQANKQDASAPDRNHKTLHGISPVIFLEYFCTIHAGQLHAAARFSTIANPATAGLKNGH
jgi:hypothetical protein